MQNFLEMLAALQKEHTIIWGYGGYAIRGYFYDKDNQQVRVCPLEFVMYFLYGPNSVNIKGYLEFSKPLNLFHYQIQQIIHTVDAIPGPYFDAKLRTDILNAVGITNESIL